MSHTTGAGAAAPIPSPAEVLAEPLRALRLAAGLLERGCHEDALAVLEAALARSPGHPRLAERAVSLLLAAERWAEAWALWPRGLASVEARFPAPTPSTPRWDGSALGGRRLGVYPHLSARGDGDIILFARYLPLIHGGRVLAVSPERLHRLFEHSLPGVRAVLPAAADGCDAWCTNAELPTLLGETGPPPSAPYLQADEADVRRWRGILGLESDHLNVGLAWQPGGDEGPPRGPIGSARGIDARWLPPLLETPGVRWIGLQKGEHSADTTPHRLGVERVGPRLADYADTAAVIDLLDLVITCDTSVANLAGAMGAPCWVLLPIAPDCRWGRGETAAAWYPSCRLFRQQRPGDWGSVIERVAEALRSLVAGRR